MRGVGDFEREVPEISRGVPRTSQVPTDAPTTNPTFAPKCEVRLVAPKAYFAKPWDICKGMFQGFVWEKRGVGFVDFLSVFTRFPVFAVESDA